MIKVYCVCFYNIYEGTYAPSAVFSTLEKAEEHIKTLDRYNDDQSGHLIEEYELDLAPKPKE